MSGEENQNNYNYSNAPIPNTPFTMWYEETKGYMISHGNSAITKWQKTEKEALAKLPKTEWETLIAIIASVSANVYDMKTDIRIAEAIKQGGQ